MPINVKTEISIEILEVKLTFWGFKSFHMSLEYAVMNKLLINRDF